MSACTSSRFVRKYVPLMALAGAFAAASPAKAVDPVVDATRPNEGLTATAPRPAERETKRDIEKTPTLTERFGLPPVSGPLPLPAPLPPLRHEPVLQDRGPAALPPPPLPRPQRAREPRDRDG